MQKIIISLSLLILFNCSTDGSSNNNRKTEIDLITGLYFKQDSHSTPIQLGNPNVFTKIDPDDLPENNPNEVIETDPNSLSTIEFNAFENDFISYPNPVISQLVLQSYHGISDVWIIPGKPEKIYQDTDFNTILNSNLYTESEVESKSVIQSNNLNGGSTYTTSTYTINVESLTGGYYKVFVKIYGKLYWDNFYKQGDNFEYSAFESLINWWNN